MANRHTDWTIVTFGLALAVMAAFQLFKLPPVLPVLLERYHYDLTLTGAYMSIYAVAGLILSVPLARRLGRQGTFRPLLIAFILMTAGNLLVLVWPQSGLVVLGARALEGVAFAVFAIVGPVLVNRNASPLHLPLLVGLTATWIPAGQLIASLATPLVLRIADWQGLWALGLLATAVLATWTFLLRTTHSVHFEADQTSHSSEPRGTAPALSKRERHGLILGAGTFTLWSCQFFAFMTWLPEYLTTAHGLSLDWALAGYVLPVAILLVFNVIAGALLRAGLRLVPLLCVALVLQIIVWFGQSYASEPVAGLALLVAYGIGAGISPTCLFAVPSAVTGPERAMAAFGILMTGRNLGVLIGPVLLAMAFELTGSWEISAPLFGGITLAALIATLALGRWLRR